MSTNIVDSPVFTSPVVVPAAHELLAAATTALTAQALANRTAYLNQQYKYKVRTAAGPGGIGSFAALAATLTDIPATSVIITPEAGDTLIVLATTNILSTASGTQAQLRLRYSSASVPVGVMGVANKIFDINADGQSVTLFGVVTAGFNEATTIILNGTYIGPAGANILNNWQLIALSLKGV